MKREWKIRVRKERERSRDFPKEDRKQMSGD